MEWMKKNPKEALNKSLKIGKTDFKLTVVKDLP